MSYVCFSRSTRRTKHVNGSFFECFSCIAALHAASTALIKNDDGFGLSMRSILAPNGRQRFLTACFELSSRSPPLKRHQRPRLALAPNNAHPRRPILVLLRVRVDVLQHVEILTAQRNAAGSPRS